MAHSVNVRVTSPDDSAGITTLLRASFPELMRSAYNPAVLSRVLPQITVAQPGLLESGTYYVAETSDEVIIGCGGWTRERPGSSDITANVGHIRHFGVHPDWARRGVATAIYRRCRNDARDAGLSRFECYSSLNGEAFYAAQGFRPLARIELDMSNGLRFPCVHMIADI